VNLCTGASAPSGFVRRPGRLAGRSAIGMLGSGSFPPVGIGELFQACPCSSIRVVRGEVALGGLRHERVVRIADVGYGALGYLGHKLIRVQLIEAVARGQPVDQIHVCDSKCVLERPGGTCREDVLPREGGASSPMQ
jgi:hypothetical protein